MPDRSIEFRLNGEAGMRPAVTVELPRDTPVHKGRLLALRYDPARFRLFPHDTGAFRSGIPTDVVPPMRETG